MANINIYRNTNTYTLLHKKYAQRGKVLPWNVQTHLTLLRCSLKVPHFMNETRQSKESQTQNAHTIRVNKRILLMGRCRFFALGGGSKRLSAWPSQPRRWHTMSVKKFFYKTPISVILFRNNGTTLQRRVF